MFVDVCHLYSNIVLLWDLVPLRKTYLSYLYPVLYYPAAVEAPELPSGICPIPRGGGGQQANLTAAQGNCQERKSDLGPSPILDTPSPTDPVKGVHSS